MKTLTRDELLPILFAMEKYGGGFVKTLAIAMLHADNQNLQILVEAFPNYIEDYKKFIL